MGELHIVFDVGGIVTCIIVLMKIGKVEQKVTTMWDWFTRNVINAEEKD